jgi:DNA topoisomerase-1
VRHGEDEQALVEERLVPRLLELSQVQEHARPRPRRQRPARGGAAARDGHRCDKCGKPMVIKTGRYGEFLSCTGYPTCKNAKPVPLGVPCPKCNGDLIEIRPKKRGGRPFYGCSNYGNEAIKCDFKLWQKPIAEPCPAVQVRRSSCTAERRRSR